MSRVLNSFLAVLLLAACSSTPSRPAEAPAGSSFQYPIAQVRAAAVGALVEQGFKVTTNSSAYLEADRSRSLGAGGARRSNSFWRTFLSNFIAQGIFSSGGETVGIWLTPDGAGETRVEVHTEKSFFGYPSQTNWDHEVLVAIRHYLADNS